MNTTKRRMVLGAAIVAGASAGFVVDSAVRAADHGDSPQVREDTRLDINDVYVFASPETPTSTVMAVTVCPVAGITGPKQYTPKAKYQIAIDTNGDGAEEQVYTVVFGKVDATGHQKYVLTGPNKLKVKGTTETTATFGTGGKFFAGVRDDPFFFDLIGFKRGLQFTTGRNFFDGLNTMALVLEVPTSSFGKTFATDADLIGVFARTLKGKKQIDRMGRPAINTVLIAGPDKDAFNSTSPKDDVANWKAKMVANLKAPPLSRSDVDANSIASLLLPDVLTYAPTNQSGFINGRKLTDDVIDVELGLLTNGALTTDNVASDSAFLTVFPYLAPPNP